MKKKLLFLFSFASFAFAGVITCKSYAQPANINLSLTSSFEGEPYLAINPTNPQNIVVAWMADDLATGFRMSIKSKASFDGGATWGNQFIQPHMSTTWGSADVSMQFRNNGTLYLSYIDYRQSPDSGGVYSTHSINGGISWSSPVRIFDIATDDPIKKPLDRPWLAADNSGSVNDGMLYITTKPPSWVAPPNRPYLKTSSDSGATWSGYRYVDTTNYLVGNLIAAPMAAPAVSADGALCLAYPSYLPSQSIYPKIFFAKSYSRGATFSYHDLIVNPVGLPAADSNYKAGYKLAANLMNANQLAFVALSNVNGDPDIYVTTTNDGGVSWSSLVRVNDDSISNGVGQDLPWADYDRNNHLVISWRDRRNATGTGFAQSTDTYCAVSSDNGATFQPNVKLSNLIAPYNTILTQNGNDFMGCELVNDTIYAAWGDVRTGSLNIFFAKTSVSTGSGSGISSLDANDEKPVVYPNPARDKVTIDLSSLTFKTAGITIYNQLGMIVLHSQINNHQSPKESSRTTININQLSSGTYYYQLNVDDKIVVQKLLISK